MSLDFVGIWTLDFGLPTLEFGLWTLDNAGITTQPPHRHADLAVAPTQLEPAGGCSHLVGGVPGAFWAVARTQFEPVRDCGQLLCFPPAWQVRAGVPRRAVPLLQQGCGLPRREQERRCSAESFGEL